jgi:hypothetical protein
VHEEPDIPIYRVEFTDVAQAEAEAACVRRGQYTSPEEAYEWYMDMLREAQKLGVMPRRNIVVKSRYRDTVRRMLYGRGRSAYHLFYRIIEPLEGETEGIVQILNVYSAVQHREEDEND